MKKVKKLLLAIPLGLFWLVICLVLNTLFETAMLFCYIHPYEMLIVTGYFMVMIIYCFHKVTKGTWIGYLECGFLPIICWWFYMILIDTSSHEFANQLVWECRLIPICLATMLLSSFLYIKKQKIEVKHKIAIMNISILVTLFGFFCYYSAAIIGGIVFSFETMMMIEPVFVILYTFIAQMLLKKQYRWKLFFAYIIIFLTIFLKICLINVIEISAFSGYDLEFFVIPALPYGIAVAIGELIVWISDKRKDSRLAKQEAEDMESDWNW
ncbi:MAG: hypothetical protein HDR22_08155 [Lachnospiraceae bacterium]|nr:hypothetical protein [Lachnospiraceae bacterium]